MARIRATSLTEAESKVVDCIASERQWSPSKTIAILIRESPMFRKAIRTQKPKSRSKKHEPSAVKG